MVHSWKALGSIVDTDEGMVTEVNPLQPLNACFLRIVQEEGMVTEVIPVHPAKAAIPISVPEDGSLIVFKLVLDK